jgi:hypothetical protein
MAKAGNAESGSARCRQQISFEKLCEVVDYEEEFPSENNFAAERRKAGPSARTKVLGRDDTMEN